MKTIRLTLAGGIISFASIAPCQSGPLPVINSVAEAQLQYSDVALIDHAQHEIDMAALELRDWTVIQALIRAADRGVKVRIFLDGAGVANSKPADTFDDLAGRPGVTIRFKRDGTSVAHQNSYLIDGSLLRTDDSKMIMSPEAAAAFKREFNAWFAAGESWPARMKQSHRSGSRPRSFPLA
jgi:phosphatidylserine/phosphatidylglycerophosphate/cardiolipin synthase-like enzyme